MLEKENKQETGNVENSTVNQAGRDIIYQNGLEVKDIIPIVNTLVESKIAAYAAQAKVTAQQRVLDFSKRLEETVEEKVNEKINRFNEPSIQFATRQATLGYVKSGDEEQCEDLIDLLIERIKVEEHTTEQNLIDEAIQILPKLSKETLTLLILLAYYNLTYNGTREMLTQWFKCVSPLLDNFVKISPLDISYLQQTGCAFGITGLYSHDKFEVKCLKSNSYFFTHGLCGKDYEELWKSFGFKVDSNGIQIKDTMENLLKFIRIFNPNTKTEEVNLNPTSPEILEQILQDPYFVSYKDTILNAIKRFTPFTETEVRQYFIDINPNWDVAIDLLNRDDVRALKATTVGNYIASRQLSKLSGQIIGLDIFYPKHVK